MVITIDNPDGVWVDAVIEFDTPNYDQSVHANRVDGAANRHEAWLFQHGNCSIVYYRIINPQGGVLGKYNIVMAGTPHTFDVGMTPTTPKTVGFSMAPEGTGMRFAPGGHTVSHSNNLRATVLIPNVYTPFPVGPHQLEDGKEGAFQPEPGGGGGEPVDYDLIRAIVRDELGLRDGENDLITQFAGAAPQGSSTVRKGLHETGVGDTKTAEIQLLTGDDQQANQYQDALFAFTKNASANPWANVLGGQDEWGQARQEELKDIIREVIHEQAALAKRVDGSPDVGSGPKE